MGQQSRLATRSLMWSPRLCLVCSSGPSPMPRVTPRTRMASWHKLQKWTAFPLPASTADWLLRRRCYRQGSVWRLDLAHCKGKERCAGEGSYVDVMSIGSDALFSIAICHQKLSVAVVIGRFSIVVLENSTFI